MARSSRIPGLYRLSIPERIARVAEESGLSSDQVAALKEPGGLALERAEHMIENCVGTFALPMGVATNFVVNDREVLIPMAIEEPSVIAAASAGALAAREDGGFRTRSTERRMIGQIQLIDCPDFDQALARLEARQGEIAAAADRLQPRMIERGGGTRQVEIRDLGRGGSPRERMLIVQLVIDTVDAMGANVINTIAEGVAPLVESISGGRALLRILSNFVDQCLCSAEARFPATALAPDQVTGDAVIEAIVSAQRFAELDPYRAVTHNKGVMNGVDAVVVATGNDWRAVEAAAHAYAARSGQYGPMTTWRRGEDGALIGRIDLPMAVGLVGGAIQIHPLARFARALLGVASARELGEVIVAVGLAQNFSALRALATEGIQRGHMALHARALAATAGARGEEVERIARELVRLNDIKLERARALLEQKGRP